MALRDRNFEFGISGQTRKPKIGFISKCGTEDKMSLSLADYRRFGKKKIYSVCINEE
jgi:hypothetical protein